MAKSSCSIVSGTVLLQKPPLREVFDLLLVEIGAAYARETMGLRARDEPTGSVVVVIELEAEVRLCHAGAIRTASSTPLSVRYTLRSF